MKSNFAACLAFTLRYEGGKSDDPRDPGGRTNQGVTQRTYAAWLARAGQPARDVYAMAPAERDAIYETGFWAPIKGDDLAEGVDLVVFDFGVNSGPARALKAHAGRTSNDAAETVRSVCADRLSFLHALGTFKTFGRGWTARVAACEALGVKMAEHARIGIAPDAPTAPQVTSTLSAASAAAHASARRAVGTVAGVATVGALAPTAAAAAWHPPLVALLVAALAALVVVALVMVKAHQAHARGRAYAAIAAA